VIHSQVIIAYLFEMWL